MQRFVFDIEAGDGFPDQFEIDLPSREAARAYAIDLASARLQAQTDDALSMVVCILIQDAQGELLEMLRSFAEPFYP